LLGVVLAVITSWPLVLHMSSRIAPDLGDPVRTAWQVAWVGHAMLHQPLHLFDSNAFYPHPLSLAFSDSMLGYGPAAFFGSGTVAALVRYNLLFLFAWSLCFLGGYLLARELGLKPLGAAAAAIAFAYAPYRVTEAGHLHVISSGGIPLALFLLLRGYRRDRRGLVIAGWLVAAWQVSLGFTLGLQFAYLLAVLALLVAWSLWRGHAPVPRRLLAVTCAGIAAVGLVTAYEARPYLKVAHDYPTAKRTIKEVKNYSAGPAALLSASTENRVWGDATAGMRAHVHSKNESVLFAGGLLLALALVGLAAPFYTRRVRAGLALGAVTCSVLALGLGLTGAGYPYRLLYDYAPGWDGPRTPGRLHTLTTLALALLAAAGTTAMLRRWSAARPRLAVGGCVVVAGLIALEGCAFQVGRAGSGLVAGPAHPSAPKPPAGLAGARAPLLHLPPDPAYSYMLWSTDGFPAIVNGVSGFQPFALAALVGQVQAFPDASSIRALRDAGVRTVVLHKTAAAATPWSASSAKPLRGLAVRKRQVGDLVLFEIGR
jgi:hypothetical protein